MRGPMGSYMGVVPPLTKLLYCAGNDARDKGWANEMATGNYREQIPWDTDLRYAYIYIYKSI